MAKVRDVTDYLESIAPLHLQESYDNAGLIVGHPDWEVTGLLCALDTTPAVIQEAIDKKKNLIVAHHPIVFSGLKRFNGSDYIQQAIILAIKHDIAIYAIHTNLDNVLSNGVNERLAQQIDLQDLSILKPRPDQIGIGSGIKGRLAEAMPILEFLKKVKESFGLQVIKHTGFDSDLMVSEVAACGGSGSFLLQTAIESGAQVFITADFKYHQYFDANNDIVILDIGHYESEKFTINLLNKLINNNFRNFASHCTEHDTNPVHYYI